MARPSHAIVMCGYGAGSPEWLELEPGVATSTISNRDAPEPSASVFTPFSSAADHEFLRA